MEPPLNPTEEVFRWGPLPGQYYYVEDWANAIWKRFFNVYPGYSWSHFLFLFKEGRMVFPGELSALEAHGRPVFTDFMLDLKKREEVRKEWFEKKDALFATHEKINNAADLEDTSFINLFKEHTELLTEFWIPVTIPELANYGSTSYMTAHLKKFVAEEKIPHLMEILTAPTEPSYYQIEEIELAETNNIEEHTKEYFWLQNSYSEARVLTPEFFRERKKKLPKDLRGEIETQLTEAQKMKELAIKEFDLDEETLRIAETIATGIKWQDHRKKHVLIDLHYNTLLLEECARRMKKDKKDLLKYSARELIAALEGTPLPKRGSAFGLWLTHTAEFIEEEDALKFWDLYAEEKFEEGLDQVTGTVASKGTVQGTVRILLNPYDSDSFQEGEVLVAPMTSPEYVFAMKKSCAIVTDAGGLTSHAAIVSRELGVPCIVGTKIATRLFKDGDTVEVDCTKGIVRRIN